PGVALSSTSSPPRGVTMIARQQNTASYRTISRWGVTLPTPPRPAVTKIAIAPRAFARAAFGGTNHAAERSARNQSAKPLRNQTLSRPPVGSKLREAAYRQI